MKNIVDKFKVFFPDNNIFNKVEDFICFEMALMVIHRIKPDIKPSKGYIIFTKYQKIAERETTEDSFLLQQASDCFGRLGVKSVWKEWIRYYSDSIFAGIRLYDISEDQIICNSTDNMQYGNREVDYLRYLRNYKHDISKNIATKDEYSYYKRNATNENYVLIQLDEHGSKKEKYQEMKVIKRDPIIITMDEILLYAREIKSKNPRDYCIDVLARNILKSVSDGNVQLAEKITIDRVTNFVGMVGAGKSTLLKVLVYALEKKGKRVVVVTDTVPSVFSLYEYFYSLGCDCSPLIGKAERLHYIDQLMDEGAYHLKEEKSKYLTTVCIIDGQDCNNEEAIPYGEEPCTHLIKNNEKYICPYYDDCGTTLMQRDAQHKKIVVTTVQGLAMSKVGKFGNLYLQEVLEKADVVFYDECDRCQKTLDEIFMPTAEFNKFINGCAKDVHDSFMDTGKNRMRNMDKFDYDGLCYKAPVFLGCISAMAQSLKESKYKSQITSFFSAYSLYGLIINDISVKTRKNIKKLLDGKLDSDFNEIMMISCDDVKMIDYKKKLNTWLDKNDEELKLQIIDKNDQLDINTLKTINDNNKRKQEIRNVIALILILICFDRYLTKLEFAYDTMNQEDKKQNELIGFLKSRFSQQQRYLPSAIMGSLGGVKITDDGDIELFHQCAYGRALLTDLPNLIIDEKGTAVGPHVVLLSGSSYAEGSYTYHVNAEVNYIIEADKKVRDFISKTRFVDLGIEERISGSPIDKREELLLKVVDKSTKVIATELRKEGKILLVVNSYSQAELVGKRLQANIKKANINEDVCIMVSDHNNKEFANGEEDKDGIIYIRRGDVYKFADYETKILIAPALAIERGHNIVDEQGHSSISSIFFMIRPMGVPDDISDKGVKLNGYIAAEMFNHPIDDIFEKNMHIRKEAIKFWKRMFLSSKRSLSNQKDSDIKTDIVATMFVLILQIFGRMCRVTDDTKDSPTVYFVDGAFRKNSDIEDSFDTFSEMYNYLKYLITDEKNGDVYKTLYEPFFEALERN